STMSAANAASGAVTTRTSMALPRTDMSRAVALHQNTDGGVSPESGLSAGDGLNNGLGVWIMPLYQSNNVWGMKAENFKSGYNSNLGGIALGADYTINDMFRFGAAFNVGAGYAKSSGDFNSTDNSFNFWGVSLYGGWVYDNFGLSADVGYTGNYNKVEQDMPASMQMSGLKADVTSHAWNTGLKAEYKFNAGALDIIPHVGVRYLGLVTDGYDVKSGGTVFEVDGNTQSIWTFPLGVSFAKAIETESGWQFKPQLDLGVIPAAGDVKAKSKARIPGVDSQAEMKMQVVDYATFDGGLGFELGKGDFTLGLNYNLQASEHRTGHGVFGSLRYEF
ncbi:MAG: autotransporter outer membrane beta-barrel domain-containing protein, partial [Desulfovibrio sp.]|uniref:autotransporter outer membrane beta-barrel domain-containing protein n=1 Tax=Desulfovibrio sp. TaxID=885 RepID=UPI0039E5622C